jgi:hypothetical protein
MHVGRLAQRDSSVVGAIDLICAADEEVVEASTSRDDRSGSDRLVSRI